MLGSGLPAWLRMAGLAAGNFKKISSATSRTYQQNLPPPPTPPHKRKRKLHCPVSHGHRGKEGIDTDRGEDDLALGAWKKLGRPRDHPDSPFKPVPPVLC